MSILLNDLQSISRSIEVKSDKFKNIQFTEIVNLSRAAEEKLINKIFV